MWNKISIYKEQIKYRTPNAYLIKLPNKSNYKGFVFWHSNNLVKQEGKGEGFLSFYFKSYFVFKIIKYGKGTYNKKTIIDKKTITSNELIKIFQETNDNLKLGNQDYFIETIEPEKVEIKIEIPAELKN